MGTQELELSATNHIVEIQFTPNSEKRITYPETTILPLESEVKWAVTLEAPALAELLVHGLIFSIYFTNDSPFSWVEQSTRFKMTNADFFDPRRTTRVNIASGVATEKGTFKYGIKVTLVGSSVPIADDDPYLIIK